MNVISNINYPKFQCEFPFIGRVKHRKNGFGTIIRTHNFDHCFGNVISERSS